MLAVELRFPAGRYHATPWGRNVNEGIAEWPPSPWRLVRALADAAWRRHPDWDGERLHAVLRALERPVAFLLPPATTSHVRLYQRQDSPDPSKKQKIFDTFVVIDADRPVVALFDGEVDDDARRSLNTLLRDLNYLGRSESWVEARLLAESPDGLDFDGWRCQRLTPETDPEGAEVVRVACLRTEASYDALSDKPAAPKKRRGEEQAPRLSWVEAMGMSTKDLLGAGWSSPPAMWELDFLLPRNALRGRAKRRRPSLGDRFYEARFALYSPVLPRVVDTVKLAERVRRKLMGIHRKVMGDDPALVSLKFSGKGPDGSPAEGHRHAYYLPLDEDGDGRIDHLIVRVGEPLDGEELAALDRLRSVWQSDGRPDIELVLEALTGEVGATRARRWVTATPFVTNRHYRRRRGPLDAWIDDEIRRACRLHGLPEPVEIAPQAHTETGGHAVRWMEFTRNRAGMAPLRGHGRALTFAEPVRGPFAIGALAHFGLGLFVPEERGPTS